MKTKSCNHLFYFLFVGIFALSLYACSSSTDPYKPYIGDGERVYPAKSDSIAIYPGKNKALVIIAKPVDPQVKRVGIFWRNETDSLKLKFPENTDTLRVEIDSLYVDDLKTEETYVFDIYTYDQQGNKSVGSSLTASIYNNNYANSIISRVIDNLEFDPDRGTVIEWGIAAPEMIGSVVRYTNIFNEIDSVFVPPDTSDVILENNQLSSKIIYQSLYMPDSTALDTFYTEAQETEVNKISLKNATEPISSVTINTNFMNGKFGTPAQWVVNKAARNLPGDIGGWRDSNTLGVVTFPPEATLVKNGKIYKTLNLPKGNYSIEVNFEEIQGQYERYIVVSEGDSIPNTEHIDSQAIVYKEYEGTGFNIDPKYVEFSLAEQTNVSFGFVFNMNIRNANFFIRNVYLNYNP